MPANPVIPRAQVHALSEACAEGAAVEAAARRALETQPRLVRFFKANMPQMAAQPAEVSLYLLSVVIRIFQGSGGKLPKVSEADIAAATARIRPHAASLLPGDEGFPARMRLIADRAQPHILDEALHALFERDRDLEKEVDIDAGQGALLMLLLWAGVEALEASWRAGDTRGWLTDDAAASAAAQ